ncbi:MAG: transposase [Nocardioidaceae bacterium]
MPGWAAVRAGNYGGAVGDPARFDNHRQVYRTAGLNPIQYESAGKRRDSVISREGSVELRRALIDLGVGLWLSDPAAKVYGSQLRGRGKKGLVIACAMAHRANRIAFAVVRDQTDYDPVRWTREDRPTLHKSGQQCQAQGHEGPGPDAASAMADAARRYAASSLAPGSFASAAARTKPDDPPQQRDRLRQRGRPAPQLPGVPTKNTRPAPSFGADRSRPPTDLTRPTAS